MKTMARIAGEEGAVVGRSGRKWTRLDNGLLVNGELCGSALLPSELVHSLHSSPMSTLAKPSTIPVSLPPHKPVKFHILSLLRRYLIFVRGAPLRQSPFSFWLGFTDNGDRFQWEIGGGKGHKSWKLLTYHVPPVL